MWRHLHGPNRVVDLLRPLTQVLSYFLLFGFGRRLLRACLPVGSLGYRLLGMGIYLPLLIIGGIDCLAGHGAAGHPLPFCPVTWSACPAPCWPAMPCSATPASN